MAIALLVVCGLVVYGWTRPWLYFENQILDRQNDKLATSIQDNHAMGVHLGDISLNSWRYRVRGYLFTQGGAVRGKKYSGSFGHLFSG